MEQPTKSNMFIYTKYTLAANIVSKLLPDTWSQLASVISFFVYLLELSGD